LDKQTLSTNENAARIQITVAIIAVLLLRLAEVAEKGAFRPLSFARLARLDLVHCDEGKRARARSVDMPGNRRSAWRPTPGRPEPTAWHRFLDQPAHRARAQPE
jgi:hypothetical protein